MRYKNPIISLTLFVFAAPFLWADLAGDWAGTLVFQQGATNLVLHITGPDDRLSAVADNPDQNRFGLAVDSVQRGGDSLSIVMQGLNAQFSGMIGADRIQGTFAQNGNVVPATLLRVRTNSGCVISEAKLVRLGQAEVANTQPYYFHIRGLVFDEGNCTAEAIDCFDRSVDALSKAPDTPENRALSTDTKAMLQLEHAKQFNVNGQTGQAVQVTWNIVRTILTPNAQPRAIEFLASILPAGNENGWKELRGYIDEQGDDVIPAPRKLLLLRRHDFQSNGPAAISAIEGELEKTSDQQRRLPLEILLVEFYSKSGRPRDAELLLTAIESTAGESLVDWNMRRAFLEIGTSVWSTRARTEARSASRAAAYASLLADFNSRMGRYF